jgi:hypothetical protein
MERRKLCSLVKAVVPECKIPHAYRGILLQWYMVGSYQGRLSAIFDFVPMIKLVSCRLYYRWDDVMLGLFSAVYMFGWFIG